MVWLSNLTNNTLHMCFSILFDVIMLTFNMMPAINEIGVTNDLIKLVDLFFFQIHDRYILVAVYIEM